MVRISYPDEIQEFFSEIIPEIVKILNPEYVLIAGSFAKESWLYNSDLLISDFEFEFICKKKWSNQKKKSLLQELNNKYSYDIDLKGHILSNVKNKIFSNFSSKKTKYISLNFYDTFCQPQILYSKNNMPFNIKMNIDEVPTWEAWRLFTNRQGELLEYFFISNKKINEKYYWIKIFESIADAYLIINKKYEKNISKKISNFNKELIDNDIEVSDTCRNSYDNIHKSLKAREDHRLENYDINLSKEKMLLVVKSWAKYFENKLIDGENMPHYKNFYTSYLMSETIQRKYVEFTNRFNIESSNLIRLIKHPGLISFNFKFYNLNISWRHIILLSISSMNDEFLNEKNEYRRTRSILNNILPKNTTNRLTNKELEIMVINYWKILR